MRAGPAKVLIITYYWPPSGGAGVQRWLKFAKYIPASGWLPVILTVRPEDAVYPFRDNSLFGEIPLEVEVYRTKAINYFSLYNKDQSKIPHAGFASDTGKGIKNSLGRVIRGNLFIPDPRRGWNKYAFRKACELIRTEKIKHVITTSPPHSTQLIGLKLKKKFPGIKWIADLRDPWTEIFYYDMFYPTPIARLIDKYYEKSVLKKADLVTTVGYTLARQFEAIGDEIEGKIKVIHNGYDDSDFQNITPSIPERFTISFIGTVSYAYPFDGFINAVKSLLSQDLDLVIRFIGTISEARQQVLVTALGSEHLEFIPSVDHQTAIEQMVSSSLLLLVLAQHRDNRSFLSGKLFEYIASGRPVLCLGPVDGDAAKLLENHNFGKCYDYFDATGIESFILTHIRNPLPNRTVPPIEFTRRHLAEQVVKLL